MLLSRNFFFPFAVAYLKSLRAILHHPAPLQYLDTLLRARSCNSRGSPCRMWPHAHYSTSLSPVPQIVMDP